MIANVDYEWQVSKSKVSVTILSKKCLKSMKMTAKIICRHGKSVNVLILKTFEEFGGKSHLIVNNDTKM